MVKASHLFVAAVGILSIAVLPASGAFIDDFESYTLGDIAGQAGPDGNVWVDFGGSKLSLVSNAKAHSGNQSMLQELNVDGGYGSDLILQFGTPATLAQYPEWTFSVWQYIKSDENFDGKAIMYLSQDVIQPDATGFTPGSDMVSDGGTGNVEERSGTPSLPILVKDQWAELRWEIDMANDAYEFYYDGTLVHTAPWGGSTFSSLNLWVQEGTVSNARVYYDDWSLQGIPEPASVALACCGLLGLFLLRRRS